MNLSNSKSYLLFAKKKNKKNNLKYLGMRRVEWSLGLDLQET